MSLWEGIKRAFTLPSRLNSLQDAASHPLEALMGAAQLAGLASSFGLVAPNTFLGGLAKLGNVGGIGDLGKLLAGKGNALDYISLFASLYGMNDAARKQADAAGLLRNQLRQLSDPAMQMLSGYMPSMTQVVNALVSAALGQGLRTTPSMSRRAFNAALAAGLAPLARMGFSNPGALTAAKLLAVRNALQAYHQARQTEYQQALAAQQQRMADLATTLQLLQSGMGMGMSGLANAANAGAQYANMIAQMYNPAAHLQGITEILRGMSNQRAKQQPTIPIPSTTDTLGLRLPTPSLQLPSIEDKLRQTLKQRGGVWGGGLSR